MFWVDERVVPKDHEDSNYKLALDGLLAKVFSTNPWIYSFFWNCPLPVISYSTFGSNWVGEWEFIGGDLWRD